MTLDAIAPLLDSAKTTRHGLLARCPAHEDRHPSFSVTEGDRGLLLKCWAGCSLDAITRAMGLSVRDLFYDAEHRPDPAVLRRRAHRKDVGRRTGLALARARQDAQRFVESMRGMTVDDGSHADADGAMHALADAYQFLAEDENYVPDH